MCGIFFALAIDTPLYPSEKLRSILERRGPDHAQSLTRKIESTSNRRLQLVFHSTVLALRGGSITPQPFTSPETDSVLSWNGEAWAIDGSSVEGNDTEAVFYGLVKSSARTTDPSPHPNHQPAVLRYLSSIEGPFAFVFYDAFSSTLYFGRDATGRRSLMFCEGTDSFILSSCSDPDHKEGWNELEPLGIYSIDLNGYHISTTATLADRKLHTWDQLTGYSSPRVITRMRQTTPQLNLDVSTNDRDSVFDETRIAELHVKLQESLRRRIQGIQASEQASPAAPAETHVAEAQSPPSERIAILFSGGLDCTVIARLAHDLLPLDQPIALLNVAFENPRLKQTQASSVMSGYEACPDRLTARSALDELEKTCPDRQWRFIAINITYKEMLTHRDSIVTLMRPHDTEMDLSIAMALYFASRGTGLLQGSASARPYSTPARVLISGLGADELFGGYIRHETAARRGGLQALVDELQLDLARIGTRNLGRDDRVTTHWAKEVRYPFLDETLVDWVVKLPVWQKCRFGVTMHAALTTGTENIEAGKYLLRRLAWDIGLKTTAREKKRAIQFGSRSAKMFSRKTKGTEAISAG